MPDRGAGLAGQPDAPIFPALKHGKLLPATGPLAPSNVFRMRRRPTLAAGVGTKISQHSFQTTGIITYLQNGGKLEVAQAMTGHERASMRWSGWYFDGYSTCDEMTVGTI